MMNGLLFINIKRKQVKRILSSFRYVKWMKGELEELEIQFCDLLEFYHLLYSDDE